MSASSPPKYPEYSSLKSRLHSFVGWPQLVVEVTPASLAACGFFYIGSADRVRCFQCGVTLRNWEPKDDPATEHLTWSPACPVALLPPGPDSQTGFRDVQAPPQSVRDNITGGRVQVPLVESASRNFEDLGVNIAGLEFHAEPSPASIQTGVAHSLQPTARVHGNPATAARQEPPSVLAVLELGYSRDVVDRVRERRRRLQGTDFPDAGSLLTAVMEDEGGGLVAQEESSNLDVLDQGYSQQRMERVLERRRRRQGRTDFSSYTSLITAVMEEAESTAAAERRASEVTEAVADLGHPLSIRPCFMDALEDLEPPPSREILRRNPCWRCGREATILLLPCHHLVFCRPCSVRPRTCPVCKRIIKGTVDIDTFNG